MNTPPIIQAIQIAGSQSKLAAMSGCITQQGIGKIARGLCKPSRNTAKAIAKATDWKVTPYELNPSAFDHPDDGLPEHLRGRKKEEAA